MTLLFSSKLTSALLLISILSCTTLLLFPQEADCLSYDGSLSSPVDGSIIDEDTAKDCSDGVGEFEFEGQKKSFEIQFDETGLVLNASAEYAVVENWYVHAFVCFWGGVLLLCWDVFVRYYFHSVLGPLFVQ